ncbi:glycosyltransferase family 22 protein [Amanita thiersii Skay4041]|uniref:Mannosyltransferase n=1 Tax=Amanita thiersii Skay4041 TaxID=703135 RepID=A0A2A9NNY7_9AGAR|nr:glycosyltransferase family 22 protein [Amanita thiersii Skay4041]
MFLDLFVLAVSWIHVLVAPYTKVEESFNLHATHDVLMYGVKPSALTRFDHFTFPGAVPRTLVGSVLLAWASIPFIAAANVLGIYTSKFDIQIIVRLVLASLNAAGLCYMRRAVARRFSVSASVFFTLLTCSQFHLPFWMGRTLPNSFAFLPTNLALGLIVGQNPIVARQSKRAHKIALGLLTFTGIIFRAEIALFLAPLTIHTVLNGILSPLEVIEVGLAVVLPSISLTTIVDSYFWQTFPLWPELHGLYYNVYQGKSADWGTSPLLTYFTKYLPKLLLSSLPLSVLGTIIDNRVRSLLIPGIQFIGLISLLGHKEWRFIIYVVPLFNIAAARGAQYLCTRKGPILRRVLILFTTSLITANVLLTVLLTLASMWNYPGGEAMALLHSLYPPTHEPPPHVHISNLAAQTGASLFLHMNSPPYVPSPLFSQMPASGAPDWIYNKTEHISAQDIILSPHISHVISERDFLGGEFVPVATIRAFDHWAVDRAALIKLKAQLVTRPWELSKIVKMIKSKKLWILERRQL